MDTLIEIAVALCSGALGVVLFRLLKPKSSQSVIVKVEDKQKENDNLAKEIAEIIGQAQKTNKELEKEKNKDVTPAQVDDFFNNRKQ